MTDGVVLSIMYPIALSKEQMEMVQLFLSSMSPLKVLFDRPQGKAVNLIVQSKDV